ncbi:thiamine pyrophosphate-dependent enzyme [Spirillospora sp. CA-294931]|uniref:thiamine pyrophosphate-dependent enzyme n=1 Tax=Spirillospora sp. CA-294931 TaxID=3240042 RepID=UPI003D8BD7E9
MIRRFDVLRAVIANARECPIVFTTGFTCREAHAIKDAPNHLYMTGSMGMAPLLAIGIAGGTERTTIVVDGDGALLMNPGALLVVRQEMPGNLLHLLVDNGIYESTGAQSTSSAVFDLVGIARACGYARVTELDTLDDLPRIIAGLSGPHLVRIRVRPGGPRTGRVTIAPHANFRRMRAWMAADRPEWSAGP